MNVKSLMDQYNEAVIREQDEMQERLTVVANTLFVGQRGKLCTGGYIGYPRSYLELDPEGKHKIELVHSCIRLGDHYEFFRYCKRLLWG